MTLKKLAKVWQRITTYFYTFTASIAASSASKDSLELGRVYPEECEIDTILPRSNTFQLEKYSVPQKFLGQPDIIILVQMQEYTKRREKASSDLRKVEVCFCIT